jgi:hypothetical protein
MIFSAADITVGWLWSNLAVSRRNRAASVGCNRTANMIRWSSGGSLGRPRPLFVIVENLVIYLVAFTAQIRVCELAVKGRTRVCGMLETVRVVSTLTAVRRTRIITGKCEV